jgi:hypothetical protein
VSETSPKWPTPYEIWDSLHRGVPIDFPATGTNETTDDKSKRQIDAEWLTTLADRVTSSVRVPIVIRNAVIVGDIRLQYLTFQEDVRIERCRLHGTIDFSFSEFSKTARFDGSSFQNRVVFNGVRSRADLEWTGTEFERELQCEDANIARNLCAQGAVFGGTSSFEGTIVGGQALFKDDDYKGAKFQGDANFDLVQINGGLDVEGAVFQSNSTFVAGALKNYAYFTKAVFEGEARFDGISIAGDANFEGARFSPKGATPLGADALIRFPGIRIAGQTVFDDCEFNGAVRFDQARFEMEVFFDTTKFCGEVRFDGVSFGGPVRFNSASFMANDANARITFQSARAGDIDFRGAHFSGGKVSFQDANFKITYFRDSVTETISGDGPSQFPAPGKGELDLRGFTYDRVFLAWREALDVLEPYDIQPYRQMERAFRTIGKDRDADCVYLTQRWRAFRYNWKSPKRWLAGAGNLMYWLFARFGVRPWRLAGISLFLLLSSIWIFNKPSAVVPIKDSSCVAHKLDNLEAMGVSLNYFLPVPVPVSVCWVATNRTAVSIFGQSISFALWASVLKLLGWVLVPLGVAALSGLLRQPSAK